MLKIVIEKKNNFSHKLHFINIKKYIFLELQLSYKTNYINFFFQYRNFHAIKTVTVIVKLVYLKTVVWQFLKGYGSLNQLMA